MDAMDCKKCAGVGNLTAMKTTNLTDFYGESIAEGDNITPTASLSASAGAKVYVVIANGIAWKAKNIREPNDEFELTADRANGCQILHF